jgi:hypothetical protein
MENEMGEKRLEPRGAKTLDEPILEGHAEAAEEPNLERP